MASSAEGIALLLIEHGADVTAKTRFDHNMYHFVVLGDAKTVLPTKYAAAELNVNQKDTRDGYTPAIASPASECYSEEIYTMTVRDDADIRTIDRYGKNLDWYMNHAFREGENGRLWHLDRRCQSLSIAKPYM